MKLFSTQPLGFLVFFTLSTTSIWLQKVCIIQTSMFFETMACFWNVMSSFQSSHLAVLTTFQIEIRTNNLLSVGKLHISLLFFGFLTRTSKDDHILVWFQCYVGQCCARHRRHSSNLRKEVCLQFFNSWFFIIPNPRSKQ